MPVRQQRCCLQFRHQNRHQDIGIGISTMLPDSKENARPLKRRRPLKLDGWKKELNTHFDKIYVKTILRIIEVEAKSNYQSPKTRILSENFVSVNQDSNTLTKDLKNQMRHDKVIKIEVPGQNFISFSLKLTSKFHEKWKRIHHLFHFKGRSINCNIFKKGGALKYSNVDETIEMLLEIGSKTVLMKKDLFEAFRHISIVQENGGLLSFQGKGEYGVNRFLPFGLRTSSYIFDLFAKGLHGMLGKRNNLHTLHYLNDFLMILIVDTDFKLYDETFNNLCEKLGIKINIRKNKAHITNDFLSIEIDTILMQTRLPPNKLKMAIELMNEALRKKFISMKNLQFLVSFLAFAVKIVNSSRIFLRRLYNALSAEYAKIRMTAAMKENLRGGRDFLLKMEWNPLIAQE